MSAVTTALMASPATHGYQRAIALGMDRAITPARLDLVRQYAASKEFELVEREIRAMVRLAIIDAYAAGRSDEFDGVRS